MHRQLKGCTIEATDGPNLLQTPCLCQQPHGTDSSGAQPSKAENLLLLFIVWQTMSETYSPTWSPSGKYGSMTFPYLWGVLQFLFADKVCL